MSRRWRGVGARRGEFFPPPPRTTQVAQGGWRWFADTAADPAIGDALAAEQVVPQLTGAQVQNVVLRLRVQLRSFDAVCRLVECGVGIGIVPDSTARRVARTMAIAIVALTDPWAVRELTICIRRLGELPPYARQLVAHLRARPSAA